MKYMDLRKMVMSREQVRGCDGVAIQRYKIHGLVLMENAGGAAARKIGAILEELEDKRVVLFAGPGNNGGDGFVIARHLINAGVDVSVFLCAGREKIGGDALANLVILEKMGLAVTSLAGREVQPEICRQAGLIVDAMLGTGTTGPPREPIRTVIERINASGKKVIAIDIPSGLDCDTGLPLGTAVKADCTVTFAAMKKGFLNEQARTYTGDVTVESIGIHTGFLMGPGKSL